MWQWVRVGTREWVAARGAVLCCVGEPGFGLVIANASTDGHDVTRTTHDDGGTTILVRRSLLRATVSAQRVRAAVTVGPEAPFSAVRRTDLLERELGEPAWSGDEPITLELRPFRITTIRARLTRRGPRRRADIGRHAARPGLRSGSHHRRRTRWRPA
ncbi:hypothetical protein GCM10027258_95050 [Amycolatopsis stemonae]